CRRVTEHVGAHAAATGCLARVMAADGTAVITVPYTGLGFTSFLGLLRIKTVHDFAGPEYHVRPGYDETSLARLMERHGLRIHRRAYYFRFFTRLATEFVSLAHLCYQRVVHGRRAWTWSDVTASERSPALRLYARILPAARAFSPLGPPLAPPPGFRLGAR